MTCTSATFPQLVHIYLPYSRSTLAISLSPSNPKEKNGGFNYLKDDVSSHGFLAADNHHFISVHGQRSASGQSPAGRFGPGGEAESGGPVVQLLGVTIPAPSLHRRGRPLLPQRRDVLGSKLLPSHSGHRARVLARHARLSWVYHWGGRHTPRLLRCFSTSPSGSAFSADHRGCRQSFSLSQLGSLRVIK